jgi:hypothetical protein
VPGAPAQRIKIAEKLILMIPIPRERYARKVGRDTGRGTSKKKSRMRRVSEFCDCNPVSGSGKGCFVPEAVHGFVQVSEVEYHFKELFAKMHQKSK